MVQEKAFHNYLSKQSKFNIMYSFFINSNGMKEGPYSAAEMSALQLAATTPVAEQSYGDRWFTAKDFDFDYMAKEERVGQVDVMVSEDDFTLEKDSVVGQPNDTAVTALSEPSCLGKWCWGGFLMPGLWGLFNGVYWPLMLGIISAAYSLYDIDIVGILLTITTGIILGIKGHRLSWTHFKDELDATKFDQRMSGWNVAGIMISVIYILIAIISYN